MGKTIQEIGIEEINNIGKRKRYSQYLWFISQIKSGKTAIILSPNFVVIDWETWKKLNKEKEKEYAIFYDEAGEISEEMWRLIEKRLKSN
jgi:TRAP-type C4-dicarboxylate transport system substrate-binding protein